MNEMILKLSLKRWVGACQTEKGTRGWKEGQCKQRGLHEQRFGGMKHLGTFEGNWEQLETTLGCKSGRQSSMEPRALLLLGSMLQKPSSSTTEAWRKQNIDLAWGGFGLFQLSHFRPRADLVTLWNHPVSIFVEKNPTQIKTTFDSRKRKHVSLIKRST